MDVQHVNGIREVTLEATKKFSFKFSKVGLHNPSLLQRILIGGGYFQSHWPTTTVSLLYSFRACPSLLSPLPLSHPHHRLPSPAASPSAA